MLSNGITWPEAVVIVGVLIFLGFTMVMAAVISIAKSEDKN